MLQCLYYIDRAYFKTIKDANKAVKHLPREITVIMKVPRDKNLVNVMCRGSMVNDILRKKILSDFETKRTSLYHIYVLEKIPIEEL